MNRPPLTLISHALCPYVQRVAIVLAEKGIAFERRDVDLASKPAWFLQVSPLGKTPVLLVGDEPIFESNVICEYLEEIAVPRLHPDDPLQRARHRAWIEFGSNILDGIASFYNAATASALEDRGRELRERFAHLEQALGEGPYFAGQCFSIVDAAFGPIFRYFDSIDDFGILSGLPKTGAWRLALSQRASVRTTVAADHGERLREFMERRGSALSRRLATAAPRA